MEYIKHLWNGNGSLLFSYWVIFVIGNLVCGFLDYGLAALGCCTSLFIWLITLAAFLAYYVFSVVCVWRSSDKYSGSAIWSILARVAVGFSILRTLGALLSTFSSI